MQIRISLSSDRPYLWERPKAEREAVTKHVNTVLETIRNFMKVKKYKFKINTQSALYELRMTDSDGTERFSISGWHGKGNYGKDNTIFNLYDVTSVIPKDLIKPCEGNSSIEDIIKCADDCLNYLKTHA